MYKIRQKGTEKYFFGTTGWEPVSANEAHAWKGEETAHNIAERCPTRLMGRLEVVAMDDQADGGKKDEPAVRESTKKTTNAKEEDFSDDIAALSGMRPESLVNYPDPEGIGACLGLPASPEFIGACGSLMWS